MPARDAGVVDMSALIGKAPIYAVLNRDKISPRAADMETFAHAEKIVRPSALSVV